MSASAQIKTGILYRVRVTNQDQVQIAFVPLEKFTIGSAPALPVVLRDKSVDKNHLSISCVDGQIWMTDQSMSGTRVNGRMLASNMPVQYHPGDRIQLGTSEYILQIHLFVQYTEPDVSANQLREEAEAEASKIREQMVQKAEADAQHAASRILEIAESQRHALEEQIRRGALESAENKAAEMLRNVDSKVIELRKNAELEAQKILFQAREDAPKIRATVEAEVHTLLSETKSRAEILQNQARHQADAIMDQAKAAAAEITAAAEYQARVSSERQVREKLEAAEREAAERAEKIVSYARTQSEQEGSELKSRMMKQAAVDADRIKHEAHLEAERILAAARAHDVTARAETEKYLAELYDQAFRKSEAMVKGKQLEADLILNAARTEAIELRTRAHEEANQLISQARRVFGEIQVTGQRTEPKTEVAEVESPKELTEEPRALSLVPPIEEQQQEELEKPKTGFRKLVENIWHHRHGAAMVAAVSASIAYFYMHS